jgi:hypothetical protein
VRESLNFCEEGVQRSSKRIACCLHAPDCLRNAGGQCMPTFRIGEGPFRQHLLFRRLCRRGSLRDHLVATSLFGER